MLNNHPSTKLGLDDHYRKQKVFNQDGDLVVRFAIDAKEQITKWLDCVDYDFAIKFAKEVDCPVFGKSFDFPSVEV